MDGNYISFRKAKVGGFNKKDVIAYIEKMRNDFFDYKKAVEATIDQLNAKIRELEAVSECQKQEIKEVVVEVPVVTEKSGDPLSDINEATSQLRMVADELYKNLSDFMSKINSTEVTVPQDKPSKPEIFDDVEAYIEETAKEIFEDVAISSDEEDTKSDTVREKLDRVSEILSSSANFSFMKNESETQQNVKEEPEKSKSILDSLSTSSFFN